VTRPELTREGLEKARPRDYIIRFAFGGIIALVCGVVGRRWGLAVGGMAMAFPAILPASLTLVTEHDGRAKAEQDARGGFLGAFGMAAFAVVAWLGSSAANAALVLAVALVAWVAVSAGAWKLVYGRD
jgi:hypothetical protein